MKKGRTKMVKEALNIGCGNKPLKGYINLDHIKMFGVNVIHDLNKFPYPFKANSFSIIEANHVLEHLQDPLRVLEELYRLLQPQGIIHVTVPYYSSTGAFQDPDHKSFWSEDTITDYIVGSVYKRSFSYELICLKLVYNFPFKHLPFRKLFKKLLFNVVHEMVFTLRKVEK